MLKKITTVLVLLGIIFLSAPQQAAAQAVQKGNVLIDFYYGFPNLYKTAFKALYYNSKTDADIRIKGLGPIGFRAEYMVTEKIGLGLDISYDDMRLSYKRTNSNNNQVYDHFHKTRRIGGMVTFNFHFLENNDNLDFYAVLGAGYKNRSFSYTSNDPDAAVGSIPMSLFPVAFRIGVGLRYFFVPNFGLNFGIGAGQGGVLNAGLSFKF